MTELEKSQAETIALQRDQNAMLERELLLLREENRLLREKVDYVLRQLYSSKSEKLDAAQLQLLLDPDAAKKPCAADCEEAEQAAENIVPINGGKPRKKNRRSRLPENLPTTEETIIPDEVKADPDAYRRIGQEVSEKLDVEPARYTRRLLVRPTYVSKERPDTAPINAALPPCLLEGSILSPSLLAHVLTAKYNDHLPFYRQTQIMERRHGIKITRATLCNWAELGAHTLQPLYNLIASDIRESSHLNVDETPVDYLDPGTGSTSQGYFWVYRSRTAGVLYDWQSGRSHHCLDNILTSPTTNFSGHLQCDGFSAYPTWAGKHGGVTLSGCWTHARRKFTEALAHTKDAALILQYMQKLYRAEDQYKQWIERSSHPPEAIIHYRRRHNKQLIRELRAELHRQQKQHLPKSAMGKAVGYALNQWHKLCLANKHSPTLDNNAAENAVRPLKLGAKNWLFIGGEDTGWRSAITYTLVENCRILGHDPYAYLKWVFEKIPSMTNQDDLRQLLPVAWASQLESSKASEAAA
jgi:transposase